MALILDHINGVADDNRLENLRIVCPNCAATLDTHCGRRNRSSIDDRECLHCGGAVPRRRTRSQRYCSRGLRHALAPAGHAAPGRSGGWSGRRMSSCVAEVAAAGWSAVGRKYGVSDNAVRKWVRAYERERAA